MPTASVIEGGISATVVASPWLATGISEITRAVSDSPLVYAVTAAGSSLIVGAISATA